MDKGIYTALSGGIAKAHEIELIANNLANATTAGFKKDTPTFQEYLSDVKNPDPSAPVRPLNDDGRPQDDKSFVEMDAVYTDFRQGNLDPTKRPLDVAIEGAGFLEVLTPSGSRFTRQGNLSIAADGTLVNVNGYPVLSAGAGAPQGRTIRLGQGPVSIDADGNINQNEGRIATLNVQEFNDRQYLEKAGQSLFRNTVATNLKATKSPTTRVHQGFLEGSNVNPVHEMTRLIEATRAYESHMQAIKTYQDIDSKTASEVARGF